MKDQFILLALLAILFGGMLTIMDSYNFQNKLLYQQWKDKLGVQFTPEQEIYRFKIFSDNLEAINSHNSQSGVTHTEALNQFAFLTQKQFAAKYLSTFEIPSQTIIKEIRNSQDNGPTVDWVAYGAVSPVADQGQCLASYAFSAVGAIEGLSVLYYKKQIVYSVQQMVDCTQSYGNDGCNRGTMEACFNFTTDKGIAENSTYPYTGYLGNCKTSGGFFKTGRYSSIKDCTSLANALTRQPISVVVDGNNFRFYNSGIFYNCGTSLSLGTLLVGMNDYAWTLKNSWGVSWGQNGYIRIGRGNTCGVCTYGSYPNPI